MFDFHSSKTEDILVSDITLVIGLRAHEGNPWVLERLRDLNSYYDPQPQILVIDYGSQGSFKNTVENVCREFNYKYIHIPEYTVYSASQVHNAALLNVETDFIFFMDIDFIGVRSLFSDISRLATSASMRKYFDIVLNLPAYHLSEKETEFIYQADNALQTSKHLERIGFMSQSREYGDMIEFIAPYSNIFLISKKFFDLSGGYHTAFKGHGSEDFEYISRIAMYSGVFQVPVDLKTDIYGPSKIDFHYVKHYRGFRTLNQMMASRSERSGLKIFHRWHPTAVEGSWRVDNDWKRERLHSVFDTYLEKREGLLAIDFHRRKKQAVCICKHKDHWGYFVPLRLHGYEILPIFQDDQDSINNLNKIIQDKSVEAFAIFNPYMKSHSNFYPSFKLAQEMGLQIIVIERGALPSTIYYANDVSYAPDSFSEEELDALSLSQGELVQTKKYISELKTGNHLLETAATRNDTRLQYEALNADSRNKIFVPLQLDDDMAVTQYLRESQVYSDFVSSLNEVANENKKFLFLVKPHPLSKKNLVNLPDNIVLLRQDDNIHEIIEFSDAVICYNSGVGLLAAIHEKPIITIGNAFYNVKGIGKFAADFQQAVRTFEDGIFPPERVAIENLVGKYLFHQYSWFSAEDDIVEFKERKAHGYKNIHVNRSVINGKTIEHFWEQSQQSPYAKNYIYAMANMGVPWTGSITTIKEEKLKSRWSFQFYSLVYGIFLSDREWRRLRNNPFDFFSGAKHPISLIGKYFFTR